MSQSLPPPSAQVCARCGITSPVGSKRCLNCGAPLGVPANRLPPLPSRSIVPATNPPPLAPPAPEGPRIKASGKIYYPAHKHREFLPGRPGIVTLYVIWQVISLVTGLFASPLFALRITTDDFIDLSNPGNLYNLIFLGFLTLTFLGSLVGLWLMKNWARVVQILFLLLSLILEIALTVVTLNRMSSEGFLLMTLPRLLLFGLPLWWFTISHRQFQEAACHKTEKAYSMASLPIHVMLSSQFSSRGLSASTEGQAG